jgi:hypothetical protein
MNGTQPAQNLAHRTDLVWIKVGRSEYMRGDGVTIRKDHSTGRWALLLEDGSPVMQYGRPASAHSLTWAKLDAASI